MVFIKSSLLAYLVSLCAFFIPLKKEINIVFIGDSITEGSGLSLTPCGYTARFLDRHHMFRRLKFSNQGVSGRTTVDFLPATETNFRNVIKAADDFYADKQAQLVFSIMLGTNDSAIEGPLGSPVSAEQYGRNMKTIIDSLLKRYPDSKFIIHYPLWYSPSTYNHSKYLQEGLSRLETYFGVIDNLVKTYSTENPGHVLSGDKQGFRYFKQHHLTLMLKENGQRGVFYLHPNEQGAEALGTLWAKAIGNALNKRFQSLQSINEVKQKQDGFTAKKTADGISIFENGSKVLYYQVQPATIDGKYEKAGFVHPLFDLNGNILTDEKAPDHPYHRGIFSAWHQIILNNKSIGDGWMSENISYMALKATIKTTDQQAILESEMLWKAKLADNKIDPIVRQRTKITVFASTDRYRILDFNIHLSALVDNLKIGGSDDAKGYGGFSIRLKLPKDITFVSGKDTVEPQETAVLAGPWMDITGSFNGDSSPKTGVAVFGYPPGNDHRNPWILRKVTSMQNIPFPGRTAVLLSKKGIELHYRMVVHNNDLSNDSIEKLYREYSKRGN